MPTLEEWDLALRLPRSITVESSPELIQSIVARQIAHDAKLAAKGKPPVQRKPLSTVQQFDPQLITQVAPIHILNRLGVVTTPPVPNLADICSTWAYYRYLWAFAPPPRRGPRHLRLSDEALNIDFHQKGLMSDQIGVGLAAVMMNTFFGAAQACDVDIAVHDPAWPVDLTSDASPDYLFFDAAQTAMFVVECKGTRCSKPNAIAQMRRGAEQVPSLIFTDGRPAPVALVIGTHLTRTRTRLYIVDPPGNDDGRETPRRTSSRDWTIRDTEGFITGAEQLSAAKILTFGGEEEAATNNLRRVRPDIAPRFRPVAQPQQTIETRFGDFVGVRDRVPVRDRHRIDVFHGIERDMKAAYLKNDPVNLAEGYQRLVRRMHEENGGDVPRGFGYERIEHDGTRVYRSVAGDGTMLEVQISTIA